MSVFGQTIPWWAIVAAIGVPVLLVVLTELINWLQLRRNAAVGPLRMLRNGVVPAAAVLALFAYAFRSEENQVWVRVVATVLGCLLILLILSSFNVAIFSNARSGSWRERTPKIFVEIARLVLVVVGLALLLRYVWGADVGGLVTALGVTSIVIGLALQNAVGGVISGLLLLFEQPFKIGDWLTVSTVTGRVIEVNWRAVHIDTGNGIQIIPNSSLATSSFTNMSEPDGPYHAKIDLTFSTDDPPDEVAQLLVDTAAGLPQRHQQPATVRAKGGGAYSISIPMINPAVAPAEISRFTTWLWYAARRHGFALDGDSTDPIADPVNLTRAIDVVAPTLRLNDQGRELLTGSATLQRYGRGETLLRAGVVPDHIRFVITGRAVLAIEAAGDLMEFGAVEPGEYLGQTALTREPTLSTAIAAERLTVLTVPVTTIDTLAKARPILAAEIGHTIELRRKAATDALATAGLIRGVIGI